MTNFADQFQSVIDAQKQFMQPAKAFGALAVESFEKVARHNYSVLGDCVDYAVQSARIPAEVESLPEIATRQYEMAQQFGETLRNRAEEYVSLAETLKEKSDALVTKETKKAKKAA